MKKNIILIIIGILFISLVTSDSIINYTIEKREIDSDTKTLLDDVSQRNGLSQFPKYTVPKLTCSKLECEPIIVNIKDIGTMVCNIVPYEERIINYTTFETAKYYFTDKELEEKLTSCENDWLKRIALRESLTQEKEVEIYKNITLEKEVEIIEEKQIDIK